MAKRLISVKEAAEMLGLDERSVRERLINGQLKGEKRNVGLREKWFVHAGSVESAAGKHQTFDHPLEDEQTIDAETVDAAPSASMSPPPGEWMEEERRRVKMLAEEMIQPLLQTIRDQERALHEKDRQLKLLPDLQSQAERERQAAEVRALEVEALKKQIAALEEQRVDLSAKASDLEALKAKVDELQRPWWKKFFNASGRAIPPAIGSADQ
jgi:hypothetical protein